MLRAALLVLLDEKEISHYKVEKTQKRSCWVRSWLQRREKSLLPLVSSCHDFNLFSSKCKLSLNKYKLSSKIIIIFRFVTESVLLSFVGETYFCCYNTAAQSRLCCSVSATFFMLRAAKIFLEPCRATCNFSLSLSMQQITLKEPKQCCKWPLSFIVSLGFNISTCCIIPMYGNAHFRASDN